MNIAFLGTKGIPAQYGGLETFVEELSKRLVKKNFKIFVLCQSNRFYEDSYQGIKRVFFPKVSDSFLTIPVINDVIATFYLLKNHYHDVDVYFYTNIGGSIPAVLLRLLGKKVMINSDGVEWRRMKRRIGFVPLHLTPLYFLTGNLLYFLEKLSCVIADVTIADSMGIKSYLEKQHHAKNVQHVAYGARVLVSSKTRVEEKKILDQYGLSSDEYYLTIGRVVAENHFDLEINGFKQTRSTKKLVLIGNYHNKDHYSRYLKKIKDASDNIMLLDPIYDQEILGIIRKHCFAYIHAYEVGGTNPSLLEQMMFDKPILAFDVTFNKEVLEDGGIYFNDEASLSDKIKKLERDKINKSEKVERMKKRIEEKYNWDSVSKEYEKYLKDMIK